jgi:hypothetical protein
MGRGIKIPWMRRGSKYHGYGGRYIMRRWSKYIMDKRVIISGKCVNTPWEGDQNTMGEGCQNTMGKWEFIPLVGWSIYHGEGVKIPWVEDQYSMGRGVKIL